MLAPRSSYFCLRSAQVPGVSRSFVHKRSYVSKKKNFVLFFWCVYLEKKEGRDPGTWHQLFLAASEEGARIRPVAPHGRSASIRSIFERSPPETVVVVRPS